MNNQPTVPGYYWTRNPKSKNVWELVEVLHVGDTEWFPVVRFLTYPYIMATHPLDEYYPDNEWSDRIVYKEPMPMETKYARRYPDGKYYRYMGDCSSQPDITSYIEDATLFDSEESAKIWADKDVVVVAVNIYYEEVSNDR